jgi:hypothetical protein
MVPLNVVFVPVPVPVAASWLTRYNSVRRYPAKQTGRWPLRQPIPSQEARRLLEQAKRAIAEQLLRQLSREPTRPAMPS